MVAARVFCSGKFKRHIRVAAVLIAAIVIGLFFTGVRPVYGQVGADRIPDLRGQWQFEFISGCVITHIQEPDSMPECGGEGRTEFVRIDVQSGRGFGGTHPVYFRDKYIGVLLPDGTVTVQLFAGEMHRLRIVATGRLTVRAGRYEITGYAHGLEFLADLPELQGYLDNAFTAEFRAVKLD